MLSWICVIMKTASVGRINCIDVVLALHSVVLGSLWMKKVSDTVRDGMPWFYLYEEINISSPGSLIIVYTEHPKSVI